MQFLKDNGDKEKYLRNIAHKLKKGGKIIIIDLEVKNILKILMFFYMHGNATNSAQGKIQK